MKNGLTSIHGFPSFQQFETVGSAASPFPGAVALVYSRESFSRNLCISRGKVPVDSFNISVELTWRKCKSKHNNLRASYPGNYFGNNEIAEITNNLATLGRRGKGMASHATLKQL